MPVKQPKRIKHSGCPSVKTSAWEGSYPSNTFTPQVDPPSYVLLVFAARLFSFYNNRNVDNHSFPVINFFL